MKRMTFVTFALCACCSFPTAAHAWEARPMTRADCLAALGTPGPAITSKDNPDPVRRCERIPQTSEETAIRQREMAEARKRYDAQKTPPTSPSSDAR